VAASELWSFVDFNAPERYYTLRFVLVTEEETLDAVADRVGCTRSELLRYNQLSGDTLHPGQAIAVPQATVVPVDTEAV
jgi:stage VI sporulation protein D